MFCSRRCHLQHHCTNVSSLASATVTITDEQMTSEEVAPKLWQECGNIKLHESHKKSIEAGEWLCDNVINFCQLLLKKQYPHISGLQSTILADIYGMNPQPNREFVQVLNVNRNHWIIISTINCPPSTVSVYDSFHLPLSSRLKKLAADLMQSPSKAITIQYCDVQ